MTRRFHLFAAALLALFPAPALAQGAHIERSQPNIVEVVGGTGPTSWRLRYGTINSAPYTAGLFAVSPDRAYLTNGSWLRLIDTDNGLVIGRWRFPYAILQVVGDGSAPVSITFQLPPYFDRPSLTVPFDPSTGRVPDWDVGALLSYRTADTEASQLLKVLSAASDPWLAPIPDAASAIPSIRDAVRRDPSAPMLRLALAKLLRDAGDGGADAAFQDVLRAASNDYTEWFRISTIFAQLQPPNFALADAAFDRAFTDFVRRDRDPRLVDMLISRLVLFPFGELATATDAARRWYLDRAYLLAPTSEATERAWAAHGRALERAGDPEAAKWLNRAETSRRQSLSPPTVDTTVRHDQLVLIGLSSIAAAWLFFISRVAKYGAQRRMHVVAATRLGRRRGIFLGLNYWTSRERITLLIMVLVGWGTIGVSSIYSLPVLRGSRMPPHAGSLSGHQSFDSYPPSAERTLLQAIALQQRDQLEQAEQLYRSVPQLAQSWNNIGVIHSRAGRTDESAQAFARALEIDPSLPEAILNSTGEARDVSTETFKRYAPNAKMIALPSRAQALAAFVGTSWKERCRQLFFGLVDPIRSPRELRLSQTGSAPPAFLGRGLFLLMLGGSIALCFVRRDDATVPPGRLSRALDYIVPGTSAVWQWAGVLAIVTWATAVLAAVLQVAIGTPYLLFSVMQFSRNAFGYEIGYDDLNPPLVLLVSVAIALWAANFALIRWRRPAGAAFP